MEENTTEMRHEKKWEPARRVLKPMLISFGSIQKTMGLYNLIYMNRKVDKFVETGGRLVVGHGLRGREEWSVSGISYKFLF